ncbi:MAG: hypothetical protein J5636_11365 [Clostridiales bacterium]|nr:hypothetical protein [Clostridiales bacterium]
MKVILNHKISSVFITLFLLAGVCNLLTRTGSMMFRALMFSCNLMIFIGLIVFWADTIRTRLLPTRTRSYIFFAAALMLTYIIARGFKYRAVTSSDIISRHITYFYFLPIIMVPTMLLTTALSLLFGEKNRGRKRERAVIFSSLAVFLLVMTNDLHHLVYRPVEGNAFDLDSSSYSWGPAFFAAYAWVILTLLIALAILFNVVGRKKKNVVVALVWIIGFWIVSVAGMTLFLEKHDSIRMYNKPEIDVFVLLLIFECCIRSRLIPYNQNHGNFFKKFRLPALITDADLNVVHKTVAPIGATRVQLQECKDHPVYLDEETRLMCMPIPAGYAFWTENEHELLEKRRSLAEANEILNEENDLIAVENHLREQKARLDAQNQVYARIAAAIRPKQKRIETLLMDIDPEDSSFGEALGKVCVLNAYSKRKTNLLLLSEETLTGRNRELYLALSESCRFMKCCGIEAATVGEEYSDMPLSDLNDLYDTFEMVVEAYLPVLTGMTVSILPEGIRIAAEAKEEREIPETVLPVEVKESDGVFFFTIRRKGGEST